VKTVNAVKTVKGKKVRYKKTTFKVVGPANYAKLYKAAYTGIKSGNRAAKVAVGETSARGRDKPLKGVSDSIAPGTFARYLAKVKGLRFDAWAHHPYPSTSSLKPTQKVRYPNVALSTLPTFERDLKRFFHRSVPVWITEYGHETKPADRHGATLAQQAAYAKQALGIAKADPDIQMFIWFVFRDSKGNPWQSGLFSQNGAQKQALGIAKADPDIQMFIWFVFRDSKGNPWQSGLFSQNGAQKPAFNAFGAVARLIDGTASTTKPGVAPRVTMFVPYLAHYSQAGSVIGMTYVVSDRGKTIVVGQPATTLNPDQSITFVPDFKPVKGHTYTITANLNESNGHNESRTAVVTVS